MKKLLLFLALVLMVMPSLCFGANVCVGASATGTGSGADWDNQAQWSTLTFARGNTYYLADGSYATKVMNTAVSGSICINIIKAVTDTHGTETGWENAYGDDQAVFTTATGSGGTTTTGTYAILFTTDYWTFDGAKGSGTGSTVATKHGFKVTRTDTTSTNAWLIGTDSGADYITFSHVELAGMGMKSGLRQSAVYCVSSTDSGSSNLTFDHCYSHDVTRCHMHMNYVTNATIEYNYFKNQQSTIASGVHGGAVVFNYSGSSANNIIRYNIWQDNYSTAYVEIKDSVQQYFYIYGNLFFNTQSWALTSNGVIANTGDPAKPDTCDTNNYMFIYNNTFVDISHANIYFCQGSNNSVYDNLWYNCTNISFTNCTHDYNSFSDSTHGEANGKMISSSSIFTDYAGDDFTLAKATNPGIDLTTWTPPVVTTTPTTVPTTTIPGETTIPTTAPTTTPTTVPGGTVTCTAANHLLFYWGCEGTVDQTNVDVGIACSSSIAFKDYGGCSQGSKLLIGSIIQDVVTAADQPCIAESNACLCPKTLGETGDDLCNSDVSDYAIPVGDRVCVSPDSAERFIYPTGTTNYGKVFREDIGTLKFLFSVYDYNNVTANDYVFIAASDGGLTNYFRFFIESSYPRTAANTYLSFTRKTAGASVNVNLASQKVGITEKAWYSATYNWQQLTNGTDPSMRLQICDYNTTTHTTSNCYENEITTVLPAWTAYCTARAGGKEPPCYRDVIHFGNWEHTTVGGAVLIDEIYIYDDWRE